jgi:hypothetical protein
VEKIKKIIVFGGETLKKPLGLLGIDGKIILE